MLLNILFATFISSFVSLVGALLLARKQTWSQPFSLYLTALSSGVLITAALMHLAPEAIEEGGEVGAVFGSMFTAIILFFFLERTVLWYHHHHQSHGPQPAAWLITVGDSLHNFIDGVTLASTFMLNPALGFMSMIAIGAHEIPQEIADFAVMVNSGVSRKKALLLNIFSALASFAGAIITYYFRDSLEMYLPYLAAFSAGMFLYIALSDLIPELHHKTKDQRGKWLQLVWFGAGIGLLFVITNLIGETH
jgi:zinc and cadmium transporter